MSFILRKVQSLRVPKEKSAIDFIPHYSSFIILLSLIYSVSETIGQNVQRVCGKKFSLQKLIAQRDF